MPTISGVIARKKKIVGPDRPSYQVSKDEWNESLLIDSTAADGLIMVRDRTQPDGFGFSDIIPPGVSWNGEVIPPQYGGTGVTTGLTQLNADYITSGTLADERLSPNVVLRPIPVSDMPHHGPNHYANAIDPIPLDRLAPATDIMLLNATEFAHGLLPKLIGDERRFLNGAGNWALPSETGNPVGVGAWLPLTNGLGESPELVFDDRGDLVVVWVENVSAWTFERAGL